MGYFDGFGRVATESTSESSLEASAALNGTLECDLKVAKSGRGGALEFLGIAVRIRAVGEKRQVHLSLSVARVGGHVGESSAAVEQEEVFVAHMRKIVGDLNFAQTLFMDGARRVALPALYDRLVGGGGGQL